MIISGGENINYTELEQAVTKHPTVDACAVIDVPDKQWGEPRSWCSRAGQQATGHYIREHCKTLIDGYKCPRIVRFVAPLPMIGAGVVLMRSCASRI